MFFLSIAMSIEGSCSSQCLTGTSKSSWRIVLWCPLKCITKTNGENLVNSENMKVEPPIQLFSFMLNRHWIQFEVKHFVHKHNFLQQALKIDFYTNYRVFTATQMACQVNFSLMFPLHDLGGRVWFWGMRKTFLLTDGQFLREIKTFISICHFFTVEFYIMNYFYGQLVFVCWHSSCLRFIYSGNETKTSLGSVDQLLFLRLQFEWFIISWGSEGITTTKNQYVAPGPIVGFGCCPIDLFFWRPQNWLRIWNPLFETAKIIALTPLKKKKFRHAVHKFILL